ncbi:MULTISPECIES: ribbon-helix-helix domain-containing protein [Brevundimonas]|jgi:Arc/MetJ-type ribon-helix-helix transcriptional regulator|uniref:Arc/MetJ-type ribon-helix-helix transcriptional regulator n=1 Tax=Brevundimonas halotolerans TaxID=69670 RepID=A0A7W9A5E2_9CAUL|nr:MULTISPECIES: hypothetical protein [Brevundimonas]MAL89320.1 hypothetical protein [Brevundimonas sp.]MBB5661739.1 Arc/MetJ-type ribon-helix-helix transcriptional regulator [Brevundimonas halotolerans]HAJ03976.1 hypothetical protein [Brevundimonas sp.]HAV50115.1 hypothetical protein [Brevundimonas sp.]|tara:strand:+ start:59708 stop:59974 length:267 start_codon:yes stop_codon:yes gene_type:complete
MSAKPRTVAVDPETASILDNAVASGRFTSTEEALGHAVRALDTRHRAVSYLNAIADEALADMGDLVDLPTVRTLSDEAINGAAAKRGA